MSRLTLNYASLPRRPWYAIGWVLEVLELLLAFGMLLAIVAMMAASMVLVIYQRWVFAGLACISIPLVIVLCLEANERLMRARQRAG